MDPPHLMMIVMASKHGKTWLSSLSPPSCCFLAQVKIVFLFLVNHQKVENIPIKIYRFFIQIWINDNVRGKSRVDSKRILISGNVEGKEILLQRRKGPKKQWLNLSLIKSTLMVHLEESFYRVIRNVLVITFSVVFVTRLREIRKYNNKPPLQSASE